MAGFVETADRLMEAGHVESSTIQDKKERVAGARNGGRTLITGHLSAGLLLIGHLST